MAMAAHTKPIDMVEVRPADEDKNIAGMIYWRFKGLITVKLLQFLIIWCNFWLRTIFQRVLFKQHSGHHVQKRVDGASVSE